MSSDQTLLEQTRAGDSEAFGELMKRHYQTCFQVARSILHDRADAQDAVQDAMCRALTHLEQYHEKAPFINWLIRIVVNYSLMQIRARKRVQFVSCDAEEGRPPIQLPAVSGDPEREVLDLERNGIVEEQIQLLPHLFRTVILLYDLYELPIADIAKRLQITPGAVKSRLLRARIELKKRVGVHYGLNSRSRLYFSSRHKTRLRSAQDHKEDSPAPAISHSPSGTQEERAHNRETPVDRRTYSEGVKGEDQESYSDEIPFNPVWPALGDQSVVGSGREIRL